ncbi:hypothetical protein JRO89_XS08G0003100 [Xanthoceras sorbifolium]|uniref:Late embryogenesis abundant protein LEA-2 subgroup domain-containing protein n=1 Tax=Xanthoceras sorbifolium TaxID=99658 RepID=A0ABQ8HMX7_9ROSI|nr:hypothetical protein JRO89_XS08G0003100 [Xanthoceras sorbifolium]
MEERVPPSRDADEPLSQRGRSHSSFGEPSNVHVLPLTPIHDIEVEDDDNITNPRPLVPAQTSPRPRETNTLVIQIPKDQIYRVPPPENAKIVESYRNPVKKKGRRRLTCCFLVFTVLLLIAAIIGIAILVIRSVFKPEAVSFSIVDVRVTNKTHIGYDFTLKSKNPSEKLGVAISGGGGGGTSLFYKSHEHELSKGKFPELSVEAQESKNVHIKLDGTKSGLPGEIRKKLSDGHQVSLELKMDFSAKYNWWVVDFWGKKYIEVDCKFKVKSLKKSGNKILSQKCDSKIK